MAKTKTNGELSYRDNLARKVWAKKKGKGNIFGKTGDELAWNLLNKERKTEKYKHEKTIHQQEVKINKYKKKEENLNQLIADNQGEEVDLLKNREDRENIGIQLALEDFVISAPQSTNENYSNKALTENLDVRESYANGTFAQKFTFDAAKRETEKLGKKLLPSATVFQDIYMKKYKGNKEAFIKGENLTVFKTMVDDYGFDFGPGFFYVFDDGSVFAMFNNDVLHKRKEYEFFGIYPHKANSPDLKDHLFSVRLSK